MANIRSPRRASMQYWPRKRACRIYPRIRYWPNNKNSMLQGFAGYKVGMTNIIVTDNRKNAKTKGEEINMPVTVVECPPLKIASVRFYKKTHYGLKLRNEVLVNNDKDLARKLTLPKKLEDNSLASVKHEDFDDVRVNAFTQPRLTGFGKKKPELFEIALSGNKEEKLKYIRENIGKEIPLSSVFKEGQQVDIHAVSKGHGIQGPVLRFRVGIRSHKSEKTKRGPGSLGAWCGQGHMMYRVAHAGQMGYHTRMDFNKWIVKISNKPEEINPNGGFLRYGLVKSEYLLVKGSVIGPQKRLIRFNFATRENEKIPKEAPSIEYINLESKQ